MGPADHVDITGAKGGSSKPKTPVEAPDSLQSTNIGKILIAVGRVSSTVSRRIVTSTLITPRSWMPTAA